MPEMTAEQIYDAAARIARERAALASIENEIKRRRAQNKDTSALESIATLGRVQLTGLHKKLAPAQKDLQTRINRIYEALKEADASPRDPTKAAKARRALKELETVAPIYEAATYAQEGEYDANAPNPKWAEDAAVGLSTYQRLKKRVPKARKDYLTLTKHGERLERKAERDAERRAQRALRHNRRSEERRRIEEAKARGDRSRLGRRLGLSDAKGAGMALIAYIMTLQPKERERFLATPNVLGFTQEAVRRFEKMQKEREKRDRELLAQFRDKAREWGEQGHDEWLGLRVAQCFPPPRDLVARARTRRPVPSISPRAVYAPFRSEEILNAARAVYRAGVAEGRCATGVTGTQAYVALVMGQLAKGTASARGWVRFAPDTWDPGRKVIVHLLNRVRTLTGDMRPMTTIKGDRVTPLDLEAFRNDPGGGSILPSVRRARRGRPAASRLGVRRQQAPSGARRAPGGISPTPRPALRSSNLGAISPVRRAGPTAPGVAGGPGPTARPRPTRSPLERLP